MSDDLLDLIRVDHKYILEYMTDLWNSRVRNMVVLDQLSHEIFLHLSAEEEALYAWLDSVDAVRDRVEHSFDEHQQIRDLVSVVKSNVRDPEEWTVALESLKETVEAHFQLEESEIFELARKYGTESKLKDLAWHYQNAKNHLLGKVDPDLPAEASNG